MTKDLLLKTSMLKEQASIQVKETHKIWTRKEGTKTKEHLLQTVTQEMQALTRTGTRTSLLLQRVGSWIQINKPRIRIQITKETLDKQGNQGQGQDKGKTQ
jgi:hypothetical protein